MKTSFALSRFTGRIALSGIIGLVLLSFSAIGNPDVPDKAKHPGLNRNHLPVAEISAHFNDAAEEVSYGNVRAFLRKTNKQSSGDSGLPDSNRPSKEIPGLSVQVIPVITNSANGILNGVFTGTETPVISYQVIAYNLTDNLTITASTSISEPSGCEAVVSMASDSGYSSSISMVPSGGMVDTTIYVRPGCTGTPFYCQGMIVHTSAGAANDTIMIGLQNETEDQTAPVVTLGEIQSMPSSVVMVPFSAVNFNGISKAGYYIDYDPSVLTFAGIDNINAALPDTVCYNCPHAWICCDNPDGYILSLVSFPDSAQARLLIEMSRDSLPFVVPDGGKLFDLVFSYSEDYTGLTIAEGYSFAGDGPYDGSELTDQPATDYYHNGSVGPYLSKTVLLELNIEGLYNPETGLMNQAMGRGFPENVADEITVCLAKSTFPYSIVYVADSIQLYRTGQCRFEVPGNFETSYYIVIRHRNSIETWTRFPVSFSSGEIAYSFTDDIHQAFKDNQLLVYDKYCILNGDINQDGFVDSGDMTILDNESSQFTEGYNQSDLNGDFSTDTGDFYIVDNNTYWFASAHRPNLPYPELVTSEVYGITSDSAWAGGEVIAMGSSDITSRGICWNTIPNPTLEHFSSAAGSGLGSFTSQLTGLMPDTIYFVSAYTANADTLVYGNQVTFRTLAELPVVTTAEVTSIQDESAVSGGTLVYDGGAQITQRGVCWSTSPSPTLADSTSNEGGGGGTFLSQLTGLAPYTTYYLRAYAMNSAGTAYGEEVVFTTEVPSELTDGNNYAHYIFEQDANVRDANNLLSQLRDITQGNVPGNDIFNGSGSFDSPTGWSMSPGWSVSEGKLISSASGSGSMYRTVPASLANAVYDISYTVDSISSSWVRNINCYPIVTRTIAGSYAQNVVATSGYLGLNKNTSTVVRIDNFTAKRIAGNHLVQTAITNQPLVRTNYILFDGVDNYLRTAVGSDLIGSVYVVVQKEGVDSCMVVTNNLNGIGQYLNKRLTIGANDALSGFYNLRIKEILIRKTTDEPGIQAKLNAYFEKKIMVDGYGVPRGKTSSPATNPDARQFIVTFIDDDATEGAYPQDPTARDHPYQGGYYTRLHPAIVAANRYLLSHNLIQPGEEIAPAECVYVQNRLSTNPAHTNYYERAYHLKCLQDLYGWEIANHSYTHFGYVEGQTIADIEEDAEFEVNTAFDELENLYGFNISTFVYPKGIHSHILREKVAERHTSAYADRGTFAQVTNHNMPPLNHNAISRKTIDYILCDAAGNLTNPTVALNAFKSYVNEARDAKGWLVTMSHMGAYFWKNHNALFPDPNYPPEWIIPCAKLPADWQNSTNHIVPEGWYPYPNSLLDCFYKMIIYIYEQGGRIVLPRDGIEIYGNQSTTGDVTWGVQGYQAIFDQPNYEHKAVGVDGSVTSYRE